MLKSRPKVSIELVRTAILIFLSSTLLANCCPPCEPPKPKDREYDIVEVYDIATDTWSELPNSPMITPRSVSAAGVINGRLYVVGGSDQKYKTSAYDSLEVFDPETGLWSLGPPMPGKRDGPGAVVHDGKLYVIGGSIRTSYYSDLFIYDSATNTWTIGAQMPSARYCPAVGVIEGKIYVAGGMIGNPTGPGILDIATFEIYDIATDMWLATYEMPTARGQPAFGVIDGKLYVAGGFVDTYETTDVVEFYTPSGIWRTTSASMNITWAEGCGVVYQGKLYVMGGITQESRESHTILNTLSVFDPILDTWTRLEDMPTARSEAAAGVIDGKIYVVGGYQSRNK